MGAGPGKGGAVSYRLEFTTSADKEFQALPLDVRRRLDARVKALRVEPRPHGVETLTGSMKGLFRIRVGHYRVVYEVDEREQVITITRVWRQGTAYR